MKRVLLAEAQNRRLNGPFQIRQLGGLTVRVKMVQQEEAIFFTMPPFLQPGFRFTTLLQNK